jgi:hypothetical protein
MAAALCVSANRASVGLSQQFPENGSAPVRMRAQTCPYG